VYGALDILDWKPNLYDMRVAILSDIHSNLQALTKALALIDRAKVDELYCLGDIVGYGGNPNECVDLVRTHATLCVLGNHDLAATDTSHAHYFTKPGRLAAEWTHRVLTPGNMEFLSSLPYKLQSEYFTLVHASPLEPQQWEYVLSLQIAQKQFAAFTSEICFLGHTHVPSICGENLRTFSFKKNMRFLINVGSVGQPRDGNPQLSFGIFDTESWSYKNIRADYDISGASQAIMEHRLPLSLASRLNQGL
jgi:predicted phosphodiesterase